MFTISLLLIFGITILALLLIFVATSERNALNKRDNKFRWLFLALMIGLGLSGVTTIKNYLYPKDEMVFNNTKYHILEHKGFRSDSIIHLANSSFPQRAIWDSKLGNITLHKDSIYVEEYIEPFFISTNGSDKYTLINNSTNLDIEKSGLTITKIVGNHETPLFSFTIAEGSEDEILYISTVGNIVDTSSYRKAINVGYPLADIVSKSPRIELSQELQDIFDGTYLIRSDINIADGTGRISYSKNESPLTLVPGANMYYESSIRINGKAIDHAPKRIGYKDRTLLVSGLGRTATPTYRLSFTPGDEKQANRLELRYVLPDMKELRKDGGRLFLTSSVDNIIDDSMDGGYYYNLFDTEDNFNHINSSFRYVDGSSTENLQFEVIDHYADGQNKRVVGANEEFQLSSHSAATHTEWIFNVHDLRATNPIQYGDIFCFVFIFIFLVILRVIIDTYYANPKTLSAIELGAYVAILTLCIIRLIITWRSSTFIPIEDINASVFNKMRNSGDVMTSTYLACTLPLGMLLLSAWRSNFVSRVRSLISDKLNISSRSWYQSIKRRMESLKNPDEALLVVFVVALAICFALSHTRLERFFNIPIPIILYLFTDFGLVLLQERYDTEISVVKERLISAVAIFGYLFIQDAGFSIIFLTYLFLLHAVIGSLVSGNMIRSLFGDKVHFRYNRRSAWFKFIVSLACVAILLFVLRFEGWLMIKLFNNAVYIILVGCLAALFFVIRLALNVKRKLVKGLLFTIGLAIFSFSAFETVTLIAKSPEECVISKVANSKAHMKYRAEVQKLAKGERIDGLIRASEYDSSDITFIMRSAHNQWFINQYLNAGKKIDNEEDGYSYFAIQPHSNQGSTYTTQTTDLVITRYVIAEHGSFVVVLFMVIFLMLILIYCFEVKLKDNGKRIALGALTLLYVIALMVILSATNRIVFVGQDFPFISIQSYVAIFFPITLMGFAILTVYSNHVNNTYGIDQESVHKSKWLIVLSLVAFSALSLLLIEQLGEDQDNDNFDFSALIQDVSQKVELLDKDFTRFQQDNSKCNYTKDEWWRNFVENRDYSDAYHSIIEEEGEYEDTFFKGLLQFFDSQQSVKNDPDQLLHLRRRNKLWHLDINKKYYFINSDIKNSLQWTGDLLAAKSERQFNFIDQRNKKVSTLSSNGSFDKNILPASKLSELPNVQVVRFDKSWSDNNEPLVFIHSTRAKGSREFYDIESREGSINGTTSVEQVAIRVKNGDLVRIQKLNNNGQREVVLSWRYGLDNDNYLAKNIWMNGSQRLFYPLGKESMWTYQFANIVSDVYGDSDTYRDSTLRISLDYGLHKRIYSILSQKNTSEYKLSESHILALQDFKALSFSEMKSKQNNTPFYFDTKSNKLVCKSESHKRSSNLTHAINQINRAFANNRHSEEQYDKLSSAIDQVLVRLYDFVAVAIDGNGRIRLMLDHTKARNVDPNNIRHYNKFVRDLYMNGNNITERDIFGNKALQILPSGPGSTFKPILYTAVTSQWKLKWSTLEVSSERLNAEYVDERPGHNNKKFAYYGGVDLSSRPLSLDVGSSGYTSTNYLIHSNNLYHSVITLLGMQKAGTQTSIFKSAGNDKFAFPRIKYDGKWYSFNPEVWYKDNTLNVSVGILNTGLFRNFHLQERMTDRTSLHSNYYGQSEGFKLLFDEAGHRRAWAYTETGSQNTNDRKLEPKIRNGFNQLFLGAYPLEVSPLQMAEITMRLATLNKSDNITTLDDSKATAPEYEFFETNEWSSDEEFFGFYKNHVLKQLRNSIQGTVKDLSGFSKELASQGYYFYAKTGTLNDDREDAHKDDRMKHLLVIIADRPLEEIANINELHKAKTYSIYLSFIGIGKNQFSVKQFEPILKAIVESESFVEYMNE